MESAKPPKPTASNTTEVGSGIAAGPGVGMGVNAGAGVPPLMVREAPFIGSRGDEKTKPQLESPIGTGPVVPWNNQLALLPPSKNASSASAPKSKQARKAGLI